jgi:hypothetical protein
MVGEIKKVWWYDITPQTWQVPKKPYKNYLDTCITIGEVLEDDDCVVVIYSWDTSGEEKCFDVIPKSNIIKIENYGRKRKKNK